MYSPDHYYAWLWSPDHVIGKHYVLLLFIYLFVIFIYLFVFLGREISEMLHCTSIKLLWDDHAMVIFDNALLGSMKFRCSNPQGGLLHKSFQFSTNTFFLHEISAMPDCTFVNIICAYSLPNMPSYSMLLNLFTYLLTYVMVQFNNWIVRWLQNWYVTYLIFGRSNSCSNFTVSGSKSCQVFCICLLTF